MPHWRFCSPAVSPHGGANVEWAAKLAAQATKCTPVARVPFTAAKCEGVSQTAMNPSETVSTVGSDVRRDGRFVMVPIMA